MRHNWCAWSPIENCQKFVHGVKKLEKSLREAKQWKEMKTWANEGPIGKLHNVMIHIRRSPEREAEFYACQHEVRCGGMLSEYEPVVDGGIRWNSTFFMLDRGILLRPAIELYQQRVQGYNPDSGSEGGSEDDEDLSDDEWYLTERDWVALTAWRDLLRELQIVTETEERQRQLLNGRVFIHGSLMGVVTGLYLFPLELYFTNNEEDWRTSIRSLLTNRRPQKRTE